MRKSRFAVSILFFICIAGCSSSNIKLNNRDNLSNHSDIISSVAYISAENALVFNGYSKNWEITYVAHINEKGENWYVKVIRYKGKPDKSLYTYEPNGDEPPIYYTINKPFGKTSSKTALLKDNTSYNRGYTCCSNKINQNTTLQATVKWKGKEEKLVLTFVEPSKIEPFIN
ncbi:hypothetical protein ACFSCX_14685 [Bacillus salitolerans]|uniref:Lipoprotein n=1 Tax=Bacillus salitolerans TaxID=1437434 RepID=A0ABW4LRI5_9BACI